MRRANRFIRERIWVLVLLAACTGIFAVVLYLYQMPVEAVGYAALLCAVLLLLCAVVRFIWWRRRIVRLEEMEGHASLVLDQMPEPESLEAETYQKLLRELDEVRRQVSSAADARERENMDYYTMWVHQIKTPIAAMGLLLQGDETDRGRELRSELFRIEQYVELGLSYLRLGSDSTDYVTWTVSSVRRPGSTPLCLSGGKYPWSCVPPTCGSSLTRSGCSWWWSRSWPTR